jgi:ATP synthase I chain
MSAIEPGHLRRVERWTLILGAIVAGASFVALPRAVAVGATVGAGLMCVNAWALRALTERVSRSRQGATPGIGILLFNLKMALLIAMIWVAMRYLHIDGIGILIGLSVLPAAIVAASLSARLAPAPPGNDPHPPGAPLTNPPSPTSGDR